MASSNDGYDDDEDGYYEDDGNDCENDDDNALARSYANLAIVNAAIPESNRTQMAKENGLLNSLIQFASTSEDSEWKESVKATIIKLIPRL